MSNPIEEILKLTNEMLDYNNDWRYGQSLFNAAHQLYPEFANHIRSTDADPFYVADNNHPAVAKFWQELVEFYPDEVA